jgi:hypothetical protein
MGVDRERVEALGRHWTAALRTKYIRPGRLLTLQAAQTAEFVALDGMNARTGKFQRQTLHHAAEHRRTHGMASGGPGPLRNDERESPKMKAKLVIITGRNLKEASRSLLSGTPDANGS